MEISGKILAKKSDNKAFRLGDDWYNVNDAVICDLEKINKGSLVTIIFERKGTTRYVSKIITGNEENKNDNPKVFKCSVCGKELKNSIFPTCYACKDKLPKKETKIISSNTGDAKIGYGTPEDINGKEVGCSLGAAATVASGCGFSDPETAAQYVKQLASSFLEWIRANK